MRRGYQGLLGHRGAMRAAVPLNVLSLSRTFRRMLVGGKRYIFFHLFQFRVKASVSVAWGSKSGAT